MTMVPYTSSWYAEWRGELACKYVSGDFVITTDVGGVTDAQLLSFLGENANHPGGASVAPVLVQPATAPGQPFTLGIGVISNRSYRVESSPDLARWLTWTSFVGTGTAAVVHDPSPSPSSRFFRAVTP
jgi:hypothetical protein